MRLSEVLSKPCDTDFVQVEGFVKQKLRVGVPRKIDIGKIRSNYYCESCGDMSTFWSGKDLQCVGINSRQISIDCVLECECGTSVAVWFLVDCFEDDINVSAPNVRILKRREKLSELVKLSAEHYSEYAVLLEKAKQAHRDGLGAGAIVYLRKIFELITLKTAMVADISCTTDKGKRKTFKKLLTEVDAQCKIIPTEFSENSYKLFGELSDVVHGDYDEELGLQKFESFYRLVIGILDNINNKTELCAAIQALGWNGDSGGTP
jgi:hypothetical protein